MDCLSSRKWTLVRSRVKVDVPLYKVGIVGFFLQTISSGLPRHSSLQLFALSLCNLQLVTVAKFMKLHSKAFHFKVGVKF